MLLGDPNCQLCPLSKNAFSVCIEGRGPLSADILIIGQNPGHQENLEGVPFIGKSGKLLESMLADAGYEPDSYRLSNAVRCATPNVDKKQRAPLPMEIEKCRIHLANEIAAMQPKAIIALGDTALRSLTHLAGIQSKRGKSFPLHKDFAYTCDVWPTYHPAAVLRTPIMRRTVMDDLRRVRDDATPQSEIQWEWYTEQKLDGPVVALDIETVDENRKIVEYPTQIALTDGVRTVVSTSFWPTPAAHQTLVTHNGLTFDLPKLGIEPKGYDTMVLAHLCDETQPLGLESLCVKYLSKHGWKEDRDAGPGTPQLAEYNARDALYTLELYHKLREELGERIRMYDHIILPGKLALDECTRRGIKIDGKAVAVQKSLQHDRIEKAHTWVDEQLKLSGFDMDARFGKQLKTKRVVPKFNPASNDHVAAVLNHLGYKLPMTPSGKPSTDIAILETIDHPFVSALKDLRSATKKMNTYILPYEKAAASGDGRVHPTYGNYKTKTGRTNSSNPNAQNLDRDLKDFFTGMVTVDYAAIEFRIAAWIAREETILENYRRDANWDPHLFFAQRFYENESIQTANMLAMWAGLPANRNSAEVLSAVLPTAYSRMAPREVLMYLQRAGWCGNGKLSTQEWQGSGRLSQWAQVIQDIPEEELRTLRKTGDESPNQGWSDAIESSGTPQGSLRLQGEQRSFELRDAMQVLSCAPSFTKAFVQTFPSWKEYRQVSKSSNFALLYLGDEHTLQNYAVGLGIHLDLDFCKRLYLTWHRTFPGFKPWYAATKTELKEKGYVESPTGRRRHFGDTSLLNRYGFLAALREATNAKVQSFATGDISQLALIECHRVGLPINYFCHDAIGFDEDCNIHMRGPEFESWVRHCLIDSPVKTLQSVFGITLDIPLEIEYDYSHSVLKGLNEH